MSAHQIPDDLKGVIKSFRVWTDFVDVTVGGIHPDGPPQDPYKHYLPGLRHAEASVEIPGGGRKIIEVTAGDSKELLERLWEAVRITVEPL